MKHLLLTTIAAVLLMGCGESPNELLHQAVIDGNIEAVKQHIAAGADVNAKDDWSGSTPLHRASTFGYKEIAELLITKGADVNVKTKLMGTPLDVAIGRKKTETADLLRTHGGKTGEELKGGEPVAEAAKPEPPTAKAPDISIHDAASMFPLMAAS